MPYEGDCASVPWLTTAAELVTCDWMVWNHWSCQWEVPIRKNARLLEPRGAPVARSIWNRRRSIPGRAAPDACPWVTVTLVSPLRSNIEPFCCQP